MADIFDDVDEILGDVEMHEDDEKSFNEAELQDIMSEIEDLEKEFEVSEPPVAKNFAEVEETPIEDVSDTSEREAFEQLVEEKSAHVKADILPFDKTPVSQPSSPFSKNEVAFEARGSMSMNLDFKIGTESAKLCIDPTQGLIVTFSDVVLCINEEEGCVVTMENGMKFTIPLSSPEKHPKKKTA